MTTLSPTTERHHHDAEYPTRVAICPICDLAFVVATCLAESAGFSRICNDCAPAQKTS